MSSEAVAGRRHIVVMVATSYHRFPGDNVGSFMEPIAHGVAVRGHQVHLVAPWHPAVARPEREGDVHFHFFRYAPAEALSVFGYAGALRADVSLRPAAYAVAPLALLAGARMARRVARQADATVVHGHWVIPGGAIAMLAATGLPLVISLHGSDVYVAERSAVAARVARAVFARAGWVTACSDDLLARARTLGARAEASEVVPYGVDPVRFRPDPAARAAVRARFGVGADAFLKRNVPGNVTPLHMKFYDSFKKKWGVPPRSTGCVSAYEAMFVLKDAIERAGTIDKEALVAALAKTNLPVVRGTLRFDQNHQVVYGYDPKTSVLGCWVQWQNGERVAIFPEPAATGKIQMPPWLKK